MAFLFRDYEDNLPTMAKSVQDLSRDEIGPGSSQEVNAGCIIEIHPLSALKYFSNIYVEDRRTELRN